jgi:hypothetical protein
VTHVDTLAVYWGDRREPADSCSRRLATYLASVSGEHQALEKWYETGASRKGASAGAPIGTYSPEGLAALVAKGVNRKDVGGQIMEELGFGVSLWNGGPDDSSMALSIKCGVHAGNPGLKNSVVMKLPRDSGGAGLDQGRLKKLLVMTADIWDAEWGAVFDSAGAVMQARKSGGPFLDQMLWLRAGMSRPHSEGSVSQEVTPNGTLFLRD